MFDDPNVQGGFRGLFGGGLLGDNPYGLPDEQVRMANSQGLMGLGAGLLASSGWSDKPVSMGEALGRGLQGFQQGRQNAMNQSLIGEKVAAERDKRQQAVQAREQWKAYLNTLDIDPNLKASAEILGPEKGTEFLGKRVPGLMAPESDPTSVREYEYAVAQGFKGSLFDFQREKARAGATTIVNAPSGYRYGEAGGLEAIPGGPADPANPKNISDSQRTAALYASRAQQAEEVVNSLGDYVPSETAMFVGDLPFGNRMVSDEYQKFEQARRNFINAVLRRESGAVINPDEFVNANRQYFPMPGDSAATIEQKRQNRALAIRQLTEAAGGAMGKPQEGAMPDAARLRQKYGLE